MQAKAACVLIDLCSGALASWISHVVAKVGMGQILLKFYVVWFGGGILVYSVCFYFLLIYFFSDFSVMPLIMYRLI